MKPAAWLALGGLGGAALACRPVIAIGWGELTIFALLVLFLFGPPLWRLWVKWEAFKRYEAERRNKK